MCSTNDGDHDHGHDRPPSRLNYAWANLTQPGPLGWKLQRFFANNAYKVRNGKQCCGNLGEPGC